MKFCLAILLLLWSLPTVQSAQVPADSPPTPHEPVLEKRTERGPVTVWLTLEPAKPVIGDPLTLTLKVTAEPGVELIMPEFGQSLDRFTIREFVPRETLDENGCTLATQRYILSAPHSGSHFIPPIAIEFVDRRAGMRAAPDDEDAYEILTERIDVEVQSMLPEAGADALDPPLGTLAPIAAPDTLKSQNGLLLLALLTAAVAAAFGIRFWLASRARARRANAYDIARDRLEHLKARARPNDIAAIDAFFVELSDLVRHYLEDRFGLQAPELTTEEFLDVAAQSPDLDKTHHKFLRDFLYRADQVKFARYLPDAGYMDEILLAVGDFLEQTGAQQQPVRSEATASQNTVKTGETAHG